MTRVVCVVSGDVQEKNDNELDATDFCLVFSLRNKKIKLKTTQFCLSSINSILNSIRFPPQFGDHPTKN